MNIFYALPIMIPICGLNRIWRGAAGSPKWAWFTYMALCAWCLTFDPIFTTIWMAFVFAYAVPPTQDMFSVIMRMPPARTDSGLFQWIQSTALAITKIARTNADNASFWWFFGIMSGAVRSILLFPAIIAMTYYTHSLWPLTGLIFIFLGALYALCGRVPKTEYVTGAFLGAWLLICVSVMQNAN